MFVSWKELSLFNAMKAEDLHVYIKCSDQQQILDLNFET